MTLKNLLKGFLFLALSFGISDAQVFPSHGFTLIVNKPSLKANEKLFLYAFDSFILPRTAKVEFQKDRGVHGGTVVETGLIEFTTLYGCYLSVGTGPHYKRTRNGVYTATLSLDGSNRPVGFVRTTSNILDTRGVFTYTVWPKESGSKEIAPSPDNNIGVRWTPGCSNIRWSKGKKRNVNTGPRLELKTTDDAGIYTIQRGKRGARGYFVQIQVIAATCDVTNYWDGSDCAARIITKCQNGGVPRDSEDKCLCPPFFSGDDCSMEVDAPFKRTREFVLATPGGLSRVNCGNLQGGHPQCRGYLFCYGDLFGCKCASGWWGNNCDIPCRKGKWGIECSLRCPGNQDCDRIYGPE